MTEERQPPTDPAGAQPAGGDPLTKISTLRPRLMATQAAIERTRALLLRNTAAQRWFRQLEQQAQRLLALPTLAPFSAAQSGGAGPLLAPAPRTAPGPSTAPLDIARCFCRRIETLGLMWLLTLDPCYRDRAKAELTAMCDAPNWADHKFLVTAETAFGAAIGYDWLYDSLSESERAHIAQAIVKNAVLPGLAEFLQRKPPDWPATAMNWNLVCNGALMIAALSVLERDARAAQLFRQCLESVVVGFGVYRPDGGWVEGPGYWHYATQYAICLLDSLKTALCDELGLDASPGLSRTGLFRLHAAGPSGKLFNFADSDERHSGGYWLFWLARRYRHPRDAGIEERQQDIHPLDLLWYDEDQRDPGALSTAACFRAAGVVMLRGDWLDPNATYLGVKGGANNACEHGHYDLGSFVLDSAEIRWAIDLGPDDYALPDYFKPEVRQRYYRTGTIGHNTLVIDGQCQPPDAHARFVGMDLEASPAVVVLDLSSAYPGTARAHRGFALIDRRHVLIVDEIAPNQRLATIDWQMHSRAQVVLSENGATLAQPPGDGGGAAARCYLRIIEPLGAAFSLLQATPSGPAGQDPNTSVTKLVIRREAVTQPLRIAVLLSPDAAFCEAPELPLLVRRPLAGWLSPDHRRE